jgi:two-component system NarL family sensor kinase
MPDQNAEIYIIVLIGIALALFLVGFIITIFFLSERKKQRQEQVLGKMKDQYDQELLRSQLEIQESTLKVIAQELHDNIGQVLSVIKLWMVGLPIEKDHPAFEGIQSSREMLNKVIFDMADLTKSLHTDRITEIGLTEAIRFDVETLRKASKLDISFAVSGDQFHFGEQKAIFLFRMYQEMMNNVLKHSKASHVAVLVDHTADHKFILKVKDDGVGFDPLKKKTQASSSSGIGLKSMTNRAKLIGAEMTIQSQPENGTMIIVELPLESSN